MKGVAAAWILGVCIASCARPPDGGDVSRARPRAAPASATAAAPAGDAGDRGAAFEWPVPTGWKHETIPFPLDFAPGLPYRGVEEIRFMPGFFDPQAPGYFSYVFAWVLDGRPDVGSAVIAENLRDYFVGLARAVADGKFDVDPARVRIALADVAPRADAGDGRVAAFAGSARIVDAFTTRRDVDLAIEGEVHDTARARVVLFAASPRPKDDATWTALRRCAASFHASPPSSSP